MNYVCSNRVAYPLIPIYQLHSITSINFSRANRQEWLLEWALRYFRLIKIESARFDDELVDNENERLSSTLLEKIAADDNMRGVTPYTFEISFHRRRWWPISLESFDLLYVFFTFCHMVALHTYEISVRYMQTPQTWPRRINFLFLLVCISTNFEFHTWSNGERAEATSEVDEEKNVENAKVRCTVLYTGTHIWHVYQVLEICYNYRFFPACAAC